MFGEGLIGKDAEDFLEDALFERLAFLVEVGDAVLVGGVECFEHALFPAEFPAFVCAFEGAV